MSRTVIYSDVDRYLRLDGQGRIKIVTNEEAVLQSLENILQTYKGERPWLYDFASQLRDYLFEPNLVSIKNQLTQEFVRLVSKYDPRIIPQELDFSRDPEAGVFYISATVAIKGLQGTYTQKIEI